MNHKMEMIGHEAPGNGGTIIGEQSFIKIQEAEIIFAVKENGLPVISLVIDVVNIIWDERHVNIESDGLRLTQY